MIIVAIMVVAMAVYIFTNFSTIDVTRSIILIVVALVSMVIIMTILLLIYRSNKSSK